MLKELLIDEYYSITFSRQFLDGTYVNAFLDRNFSLIYTFLLRSPWSSFLVTPYKEDLLTRAYVLKNLGSSSLGAFKKAPFKKSGALARKMFVRCYS